MQELGEYDVVVNCLGLGAREVVPDASMVPIRGHVIRVCAPWVKAGRWPSAAASNTVPLCSGRAAADDLALNQADTWLDVQPILRTGTCTCCPTRTRWCWAALVRCAASLLLPFTTAPSAMRSCSVGQVGDEDLTPRQADRNHILQGAARIMPSLAQVHLPGPHALNSALCTAQPPVACKGAPCGSSARTCATAGGGGEGVGGLAAGTAHGAS